MHGFGHGHGYRDGGVMNQLIDESKFSDIFGGHDDNEKRMERYLAKRPNVMNRGPYILEYEVRGQTLFTTGSTPESALRRTNEKEPDGWKFNEITPEKAWFKRESRK